VQNFKGKFRPQRLKYLLIAGITYVLEVIYLLQSKTANLLTPKLRATYLGRP
jgi:hypothetical protein